MRIRDGLIAMAITILGIGIAYLVLVPSDAERLASALQPPSAQGVSKMAATSKSVAKKLDGEIPEAQQDAWRSFLRDRLPKVFEQLGADPICQSAHKFDLAGIWPSERSSVGDVCSNYREKRAELDRVESAEADRLRDLERAQTAVETAESDVKTKKQRHADLWVPVTGVIVAELSPNVYEARVQQIFGGYAPAVLETTSLTFESEGSFAVHALKVGEKEMKMKSGFTKKFPHYRQVPPSEVDKAEKELEAAKEKLEKAQAKLDALQDGPSSGLSEAEAELAEAERELRSTLSR